MFEKFRIKHEGFHRIAIIFGFIFIPIFLYLINYEGFGHRDGYRDNLFSYYFGVWKYIFKYPNHMGIIFVYPILHFIGYAVGYFLIKLVVWISDGFKK